MGRSWALLAALLAPWPALAGAVDAAPSPFAECEAAIAAAAKLPGHAPDKLLPSIARVESGRLDPATGRVRAWPWTINVEGAGYFFETKSAVIAAVQALQANGKRSIDVGCMQVNLLHHPKAFATLDEAFDPGANARYAVRFLSALYLQTRDWPLATAMYHSSTPEFGEEYQRLVFGRVITPMGASSGSRPAGDPFAAWTATARQFGAMPPASLHFGAFSLNKPEPARFGGIAMFGFGNPVPFGAPAAAKHR
ncbi:MAG: transglycosylase SLT domain-containing protein [Acetobacteraceae bacterium]|nr:transglycosylase SLT domain-containing protein [Acetobacteraceae bacterium]